MGERATLVTEHMTAMGALDKARILYALQHLERFRVLTPYRSWHIGISLAYIPAWVIVALIWKAQIFTATNAGIMIGLHVLTGCGHCSQFSFINSLMVISQDYPSRRGPCLYRFRMGNPLSSLPSLLLSSPWSLLSSHSSSPLAHQIDYK